MTDRQRPAGGGTEIELRLQQVLRAAAEEAPRFDPTRWQSLGTERRLSRAVSRRRHRLPVAVAAAVLALIVVSGGLWAITRGGAGSGGGAEASCAETLQWRGHWFEPYDTVRVPHPGRRLGRAYWCQDTNPIGQRSGEVVYAVPGVPAGQAFWWNDKIWLAARPARVPDAVDALQKPISCRRPATLTGTIEQVNGRRPGEQETVTVPFTIGLRIENGLGRVSMQRYASVRVTIKITHDTDGASALARVARHVDNRRTVRIAAVCRGDQFVATAVTLR